MIANGNNSDGRKIGYARVSTVEQRLDIQLDAFKREGLGLDDIYIEKTSAASKKRQQLELALMALRPGDTLVVWRLDRLARSMQELYKRLDQVKAAGASFKSLTEHFDFTTATGQLILGILALMAQFERQLTIERTKAGMQALKDRGIKLGAPNKLTEKDHAEIKRMFKQNYDVGSVATKLGVGKSTIYKYYTVKRDQRGRVTATAKS